VALCTGQTIQIEDLPEEIRSGGSVAEPPRPAAPGAAADRAADAAVDVERAQIVEALEGAHWNRRKAAEALRLSRSTLWRRMRDLGIE
jgi:transcriptional regulator of acetoin/glycerol metabolism